ncbi:MAG: N-acetylglucosamine-6-phosphate deacetylase [Oscillospiraceae bacterium]|nr:N-acetylglucosamine-6-phosphate deacetylase [Oscillospiraceae bacterium]
MKGYKNTQIYIQGRGIVRTSIGIENGRIAAIGDDIAIEEVATLPQDAVVLPGFIDQHTHGAANADTMDGGGSVATIAKALPAEGTVAFLATTMTQSTQAIMTALTGVKAYCEAPQAGVAEVLGVNLEGPFLSTKHAGAQPREYIIPPSIDLLEQFHKASGGRLRIVSVAPEIEGATDFIKWMKSQGIVPSVGHSDAGYADMKAAVDVGLGNVTHLYNAQKALHHRDIGVVGSAMLLDELNVEVIADLVHLSAPAIMLAIRTKPQDKISLITDAMKAKYLPDGKSELGGQVVIVKDGEARLEDGTLAGSILRMNDAVRNLVRACGVDICTAVDYASANPAKNLGVYDQLGSIAVGKRACLTVLDGDFAVVQTLVDGVVVFER